MPGGNKETYAEICHCEAAKASTANPAAPYIVRRCRTYVKMVHNGIEYRHAACYCRSYLLLKYVGYDNAISKIFHEWNQGNSRASSSASPPTSSPKMMKTAVRSSIRSSTPPAEGDRSLDQHRIDETRCRYSMITQPATLASCPMPKPRQSPIGYRPSAITHWRRRPRRSWRSVRACTLHRRHAQGSPSTRALRNVRMALDYGAIARFSELAASFRPILTKIEAYGKNPIWTPIR